MRATNDGGILSGIRGLGLGCSRFGSIVEGVDYHKVEKVVDTALAHGIRYFDTADIYGQGDSETMLGRALKKRTEPYVVGTKVGQYFPAWQRALRLFKEPLKQLAGSAMKKRVASVRAKRLPSCYEPRYVTAAVERSLRRLGMDTVGIVFLHSPPIGALTNGEAIDALERLRASGKIRMIGVSCDELESAREVASDGRVQVLQLPVASEGEELSQILAAARTYKMGVIGHSAFRRPENGPPIDRVEIVRQLIRRSDIDVVLVGTSKPDHLKELAAAVVE